MNLTIRAAFRGSLCAAALVAGFSVPAQAQSAPEIIVGQTPLSDTNCNFDDPLSGQPFPTTAPPCTFNGTRTVTQGSTTRTAYNSSLDLITTNFDVEFDGQLQVDGVPVQTAPGGTFPFGDFGPRDASGFFNTDGAIVDLQSSYSGQTGAIVPTGAPIPAVPSNPGWLGSYSNFNNVVRSIDIDQAGEIEIDPLTESEYEYVLRSVNPTTIINGNSVELAGRFALIDDELAKIQFGKLSGSATLVSGNVLTPYPADTGATDTGIYSPYGLQYEVVAEVTTQLDENGLVTPKVEVKEGIEMNGSRVTGLGDGVAATDAVNKRQLDAETAARQTMGVELGAAISAETAARQQVDLQISQRLAVQEASVTALTTGLSNEMSQRIAADNALSQRIDAVSTRLDQIDTKIAVLDDRIASSTAVASALSGNAFLPDMTFNLTANVATYDGAQAGSIQMGVLMSPHVALNAGVASGFNRRGKTAARAGVTIGF